jgi:hypothetical protein
VESVSIEWEKGILRVTDFGRRFAESVGVVEGVSAPAVDS